MKIFIWAKQFYTNIKYEFIVKISSIPTFWENPVPFFCQYAREQDVENFVKRKKKLIDDPYWHLTGARSPQEYAKWARVICGITAAKMIIKYFNKIDMPLIPLAKDAFKHGVYSEKNGILSDMKYREFKNWIKKYNLKAEIYTKLSIRGIKYAISKNKIPIVSVNPNIRGYLKSHTLQKGGHLVVLTGYDGAKSILFLNNPSGFLKLKTQKRYAITEKEFYKYYAGRGLIISS